MDLITKITEIEDNLNRLADYRYSSNLEERDFYRSLIQRGIRFVVLKKNEKLRWGPSRFVGYRNNSMKLHLKNDDKDGRETTPAIDAVLKSHSEPNADVEELYIAHCEELDFTALPTGAFGSKRKYWLMQSSHKLLKRRSRAVHKETCFT